MRRLNLVLLVVGMILGLSVNQTHAGVTLGGTVDLEYPLILSGDKTQDGKASIWEYELGDRDFMLTHFHPKMNIEVSDEVNAEVMLCVSEAHSVAIWNAFMEYTPFPPKEFGDNLVTIRAGRFFVPFGYYNESLAHPVDMKTISRPLMYVDHSQEDMELHGGPRPIFMTPYPDTGVLLYGTKYLRGQKDQLWYGVYLVNGMYFGTDNYNAKSRLDIEWETENLPKKDESKNKQIGGRVAYTFGDLLTLGGSYFTGKYDPKSTLNNTVYGADIHLALGKANVRFEYAKNPVEWIDKASGMTTSEDFYTLGIKKKYTKTGWYAQLDFPFDLIFKNSEVAKKFEFATLFSELKGARGIVDNKQTFTKMSRISPAITYMPNPAMKFKVEYQFTKLGDYNATTSNVTTYGDKIENLSRIQMSMGMSF